jgi:hypothetical protein
MAMGINVPTYRYTRQRGAHVEVFTIDDQAATFDYGDGRAPVVLARNIDENAIASTAIELQLAGWVADV